MIKIIKIFLPIVLLILTMCSCADSEKDNDSNDSISTRTESVALKTEVNESSRVGVNKETTKNIQVKINIPTGEENNRFYYNRLYEYLLYDDIYDGELSKLDRSVLDGYEFIGLTVSKAENGEIPDKNLVSDVYDEGIPVFYSKAKDDFIFWSQEDNYWVNLTEIIPIDKQE